MRSIRSNIKYYVTGNVGILLLTWFLYAIGNAVTSPYFSIYLKMLGANAVDIGLTYSVSVVAQLMTIIPGGYLTDTMGRRLSIIIGTWLITITTYLMVIAPSWQLLAVFYALSMAAGFYQPALLAILIDSLPPEKYASGILVTSVLPPQIPWLVLPPIGGLLINKYGLLGIRFAYLFSAAISTIVSIIRHFTIKETLNNKSRSISLRELLRSYYSLGNMTHLPSDLLIMYLTTLIMYIAVMPINTLLPIYVVYRLGLSTVYWGYLVSASYAAYILLGILLLFYVDKYRGKLLITGIIINTVGSAIGLLENTYSTIGYMLLLQVGAQLIMTAIQSELGNRINIDRRGYGMSLLITFQLIGQTIGSYVAGELYRLNTESLFLIPLVLSLGLMVINLGRAHRTVNE